MQVCDCIDDYGGVHCEEPPPPVDLCAEFSCLNGGSCVVTGIFSQSASCNCIDGWAGDECEIEPQVKRQPALARA